MDLGSAALAMVAAAGTLCGFASAWAFRKWTNGEQLRAAANRVWAHLLEFQLFADEPSVILRAQRDLLAANGRFLKLIAWPMLLLAVPIAIVVAGGDALFAHAGLRVREATVVTVQCRRAGDGRLPDMRLMVPEGVEVETPAVRIPAERQISWRVSAAAPLSGKFEVAYDHRSIAKSIAAGSGLHWLSEDRTSLARAVLHPFEWPLRDPLVETVTIRYPKATIFSMSWLVWFVAGSLLGAGVLFWRRPMRTNMLPVALLLLAGGVRGETVSPLLARGYTVMPEPQRVNLQGQDFPFGRGWRLRTMAGVGQHSAAEETLRDGLKRRNRIEFATGDGAGPAVVLEIQPKAVEPGPSQDGDRAAISQQAYRIEIRPTQIHIVGNAAAGLFYGVQTFLQLVKSRNGALWLPQGDIVDWPDLGQRQIYWDDAHHLEKLDELKAAVRDASFFKINGFIIKLEGHFEYQHAKALVEPQALSPAQFQELTDYGLRYHVQVIPYLDAPAHIAFILKHPEYAKLREFPDSNYELCETNPDALRLLYGMYDDLLAANRGVKYFYLSTDEAYYAGLADNGGCREAERAKELGSPGKVLAEFVTKAAGYLHDRGRSVVFWGEYPLKPDDIASLPTYLINGETYGEKFDAAFRQHGIRQMIYSSTEGEERLFPQYFLLPPSRRLHSLQEDAQRVPDAIGNIAGDTARKNADLMGVVVAGWGDMGLHPETFWLGYATITAAGWRPWTVNASEAMSVFYPLYYGPDALNMGRLYQLMSQQAQTWMDSWDTVDSKSRKPIWGNSYEIFAKPKPAHDQSIPLPAVPGSNLEYAGTWAENNAKRLRLAGDALADNDELLGLLGSNLRLATEHRYGLAVFLSIAQICRQNLDLLNGFQHIDAALRQAGKAAQEGNTEHALQLVDGALAEAREIRSERNRVLRDTAATWYESWLPRVEEAHGRRFVHELDDVKDHLPDRTVDMSYLVYRELLLPMDEWYRQTQAARNAYAELHHAAASNVSLSWTDLE